MITTISPENLYKEYAKTHSELEALEDCYQNYDSRLVKEDLNFSGLCAFFHKISLCQAGLQVIHLMRRELRHR